MKLSEWAKKKGVRDRQSKDNLSRQVERLKEYAISKGYQIVKVVKAKKLKEELSDALQSNKSTSPSCEKNRKKDSKLPIQHPEQ